VERLKRLILPTLLVLAAYYAVFGGEHSIFAVRRTRALLVEQAAELERMRAVVDSLRLRADSLENDPVALERLARERFGMVRDGEVLYRFVEEESGDAVAEEAETDR
jgi:cell division protein FtsB